MPPETVIYSVNSNERWLARNELCQAALANNHDWLLMLDDDQTFDPDLLERLLARRVDVVGALYLARASPFLPIAYAERHEEGFLPITLAHHDLDELVEVVAVGCGAILIRRDVLVTMGHMPFRPSELSEDLAFCDDLRQQGFAIYCDLAARLGHMTTTSVFPASPDGQWTIGFTVSGQMTFYHRD